MQASLETPRVPPTLVTRLPSERASESITYPFTEPSLRLRAAQLVCVTPLYCTSTVRAVRVLYE